MTRLNLEHLTTNFPSPESFAPRGTENTGGGDFGFAFFRELENAGRRADRDDRSFDRYSSSASQSSPPPSRDADRVRPPRDDRPNSAAARERSDNDRFDRDTTAPPASSQPAPESGADRSTSGDAGTDDSDSSTSASSATAPGGTADNDAEKPRRTSDDEAGNASDTATDQENAESQGVLVDSRAASSAALEQSIAEASGADSEGSSEGADAASRKTATDAAKAARASQADSDTTLSENVPTAANASDGLADAAADAAAHGRSTTQADQATANTSGNIAAEDRQRQQTAEADARAAAAASDAKKQAAEQTLAAAGDVDSSDQQTTTDSDDDNADRQRRSSRGQADHRAGRSFTGNAPPESNAASAARSASAAHAADSAASSNAPAAGAAQPAVSDVDSQGGLQNSSTAAGHNKPSPAEPAQGASRSDSNTGQLFTANEKGAGKIDLALAAKASEPRGTEQAIRARFIQRVAGAVRIAVQRGGHLRLRLSPPELGSLRLDVTLKNGALEAHIRAETSTARSLLLDSLPVLRDRLAAQGIRVERFDVDLMEDPSGNSSSPRDQGELSDRSSRQSAGRTGRIAPSADDRGQTETHPTPTPPTKSTDDQRLNVII